MIGQAKSCYRMVRAFGLGNAGALCAAKLACKAVPASKRAVRQFRIGAVDHPVFLRPGTGDWVILDQIFVRREYDCPSPSHNRAVQRFYDDLLSRSQTPLIIDCGANIGLAAIWYARHFPQARIIAVEPEPENFRILAMNAANYPNILAVRAAISDRDALLSLHNARDAPYAWETRETEAGDVPTRTIPDLLAGAPNAKLLLVKIDIQGGEVALFRSNVDWAAEAPVIVFESHDWLFNWRGTFHAIASVLTRSPRDYLHSGENMFSFSHAMLAATPAASGIARTVAG